MVSGRVKAYETEDKQADQHSKETSAYNFRIKVQNSTAPKFDKKGCLDMAGLPKVSKAALDDIVADLESGNLVPMEVAYWKGDKIMPIDINYKDYVGLKKTKKPSVREVTVFNPKNRMIEVIDFCIYKEVVKQERDK
jgi:hypothetical protein